MAKKEAAGVRDSFAETCSSVISGTISVCLLILTTVFPLIYHRAYFDILETKYKCYYIIVLGMLAVLLALALVMLVVDMNEYRGAHAAELLGGLKPKNWKKTFLPADAGVIVFWLISGISMLQSKYLYESFWGNEGRYSGFFLITLYVAFYLVVSRFWKFRWWVVEAFLVSGMIMCVIGITDYFQLDVLQFRAGMKPSQSTIFTSTVGNINTYTAYVALVMGTAAARFAVVKERTKTAWYYFCMTVSFFAIILGCSDNAYLAVGAMFAFLPFVMLGSRRGTVRYLVIAATFATVIQCIDYINQIFAEQVIGLDSLFAILVTLPALPVIVGVLWLAVIVLHMRWRKQAQDDDPAGRLRVRIWAALLGAAALAVCFMFIDANAGGNGGRYGALASYLVFNDSWGTNRGFVWRQCMDIYLHFPLQYKIFGYGPDTFGIMTTKDYLGAMVNSTGQIFDTAHNEYLQFLVTVGPAALAGYLVFQINACWNMIRSRGKNPYILACVTGVLCYGFQALVNLNLPIVTPMMWFLISVGVGLVRRSGEKQ